MTVSFRSKLGAHAAIAALLSGTMLTPPAMGQDALPTGGQVVSGSATIATNGPSMTVNQSSDRMIANWQSFSIGADNTVTFNQPNAGSVALNRVIGQDPSRILGSLNANGRVFLLNPNGIVIGKNGQVQTGGFVASTLGLANADFLSGQYRFAGTGGTILNQGDLKGGVVALIAPRVTNEGTITGNTALAAGTDVTLDFDGDGLISVEVGASSLATLVENKGLIQADGGVAILTAKGANDALKGVVNNTGIIEAQSLASQGGRILLLGDMDNGEVNAAGTLQASFVETSAAKVNIADDLQVKTGGGTWLIDPNDFTIAASGGNISGATLSSNLTNGNVSISTASQGTAGGNGDIFVNDSVTWSANTLTLRADRNININTAMNGSGTAGLALEFAQTDASGDYYVNAPVNLVSTGSFSTKQGSAAAVSYTIITSLGTESSSGDGTLQGMRGDLTGNYVLGSDIDASGTVAWNSGEGFAPIGYFVPNGSGGGTTHPFSARFDGLGHDITSLFVDRPNEQAVGLFGAAGSNTGSSYLRNINLVSPDITGSFMVGGLLGTDFSATSIQNVHVVGGTVAGATRSNPFSNQGIGGLAGYFGVNSTLSYSSSSAVVTGRTDVGGLIGDNSGVIEKSSATGNVSATGSNVGGLVGSMGTGSGGTPLIRDSYATGNVSGLNSVGGLVGNNSGSIYNSYAIGTISGNLFVGGVVGSNNNYYPNRGDEIQDSFWDVTTSGRAQACGNNAGVCNATGLTTAQMKDSANFIAAGWDFDTVWAIDPTINNGYPYLRAAGAQVAAPPPPPPPPPPPVTTLTVSDFGASFSATEAPYQPTIALSGTGFSSVTEVRFTWTDPNGQTGTVTWNAANSFGGGRFVVGSDTSATIAPVLIAASDPSGTYQWTVTFVAGAESITKNFAVSYSGVVTPPPPPPPPPPVPLSLTGGIGSFYPTGQTPYSEAFTLTGQGLNGVTSITLAWTDPANNSGSVTWDASNNFGGGRFDPSADGTMATLTPTLVADGDPPGVYRWTISLTNGSQTATRDFLVNYGAPLLDEPVTYGPVQTSDRLAQNPTSSLLLGGASTTPLYVNTSNFLTDIPATPKNIAAAQAYSHYAIMSNNVYQNGDEYLTPPLGWFLEGQSKSLLANMTDFFAQTYVHKNNDGEIDQVVIAFRGTDSLNNWLIGNAFSSSVLNSGIYAAANQYFEAVKDNYNVNITVTGHSLGGALASHISNNYGVESIVFNTSPRGGSSTIRIEEQGDPLAILRLGNSTDINYNFTQSGNHSMYSLASGLQSLIQ